LIDYLVKQSVSLIRLLTHSLSQPSYEYCLRVWLMTRLWIIC